MFEVRISSQAFKFLKRLKEKERNKIKESLKLLQFYPIPRRYLDVAKVKGMKDTYRLREGKYRILYSSDAREKIVFVCKISTREKAYKQY